MTKLQKLDKAKKANFLFRDEETIVETYRDEWVYLEDKEKKGSVRHIDIVLCEWDELQAKIKEEKDVASGNAPVIKYFQEHGVLGRYEDSGDCYSASIIYDGEPQKTESYHPWNTKLLMLDVSFYMHNKNNHMNKPGFVNVHQVNYTQRVDDLMDGKIEKGKPYLRSCHGHYTQPHTTHKEHYTSEQWQVHKDKVLELMLDSLKSFLNEEPIQIDKNGFMFQSGKNFLFRIWEHAEQQYSRSHNYMVDVEQYQIIQPGKYRDSNFGLSKVPKFIDTITRDLFLARIVKAVSDAEHNARANEEFKYK